MKVWPSYRNALSYVYVDPCGHSNGMCGHKTVPCGGIILCVDVAFSFCEVLCGMFMISDVYVLVLLFCTTSNAKSSSTCTIITGWGIMRKHRDTYYIYEVPSGDIDIIWKYPYHMCPIYCGLTSVLVGVIIKYNVCLSTKHIVLLQYFDVFWVRENYLLVIV